MELWNRLVVAQFNDLEYRSRPDGFRIDTKVSLKRGQLPQASISIYNVSRETANAILAAKRRDLRVRVLAGYTDDDTAEPPLLFDGNIIRGGAKVEWSGADSVLTVQAKEGAILFDTKVKIVPPTPAEKALLRLTNAGSALGQYLEQTTGVPIETFAAAALNNGPTDAVRATALIVNKLNLVERVNESLKPRPPTTADRLYEDLPGAVRLVARNAPTIARREIAQTGLAIGLVAVGDALNIPIPDGFRFSGDGNKVKWELEDTLGINISPNRGYIEVFERRKPRLLEGPLFSWELGNLLESPQPSKRDGKGGGGANGVEFKALLTPELIPGDRFQLVTKSGLGDGVYVCTEHEMTAMSGYANEFYSTVKGRLDP